MRRASNISKEESFVVLNSKMEVYTGMLGGKFIFSPDWSKAKPLFKDNAKYILMEKGTELIKETELK